MQSCFRWICINITRHANFLYPYYFLSESYCPFLRFGIGYHCLHRSERIWYVNSQSTRLINIEVFMVTVSLWFCTSTRNCLFEIWFDLAWLAKGYSCNLISIQHYTIWDLGTIQRLKFGYISWHQNPMCLWLEQLPNMIFQGLIQDFLTERANTGNFAGRGRFFTRIVMETKTIARK